MSVPMTLELGRRLPPRQRAIAHAVVAVARLLAHLPPRRLEMLLAWARAGAATATHEQALAARESVVSASLYCAGANHCLARSIATALRCRVNGTWPTWCSGVCVEPFRAHAWVEADGRAVGEVPGFGGFEVVMRVPPRERP